MSREPRWSRLDPDVRRTEILAASRALFGRRTYGEVSITAIAEAAGVSRALVTHYFGGKRELFIATLHEYGAVDGLVPRTDLDLPIEQLVARNVDAWLDFMAGHRDMVFAMTSVSSLDRDPEISQVVDDLRDASVDQMLINHFGTTDVPSPIRLLLRGYTGMAQIAVADWLVSERATRAEIRALLSEGLLALIRQTLPAVLAASGEGSGDPFDCRSVTERAAAPTAQ